MKIAVYYDVPEGGASRTMEEELKILSQRHQIKIFHNTSANFTFIKPTRFFQDLDSIVIQSFKQRQQAEEIDRGGFDIVYVSHDRHSQAPWILRYLKTPSVFLCQEPTRAYFEEFLKIDKNLPRLNRIYESINRYFRKKIEIYNACHATAIVSNSIYSTESIFRAYGLSSIPVYLGIDKQEYFPEQIVKKNQLLIVGNNEPQKNLSFAIEIVSKINRKIRPKLVVASPRSSEMSSLKKLAKRLKVKIEILVGLGQVELRRVYNEAKLTLAVAYLEPFGLSVIESLACGTPVLAVSEAGFRETVSQGKTGFLVERDSRKIAQTVEGLLLDKEKLRTMSKLGNWEVNRRFTWQKTVDKLEKILYENCNHHRKLS